MRQGSKEQWERGEAMKKRSFLLIVFVFLILFLPACREMASAELLPAILIKIDTAAVSGEEAAVYGIQVKKEFEQIGGADIWEFESFSGDKSAYEVAKTKVLENIIRVKVLLAKAKERKIELTEAETEAVANRAKEFLEDQKALAAAAEEITAETVQQVFTEFELGQKLKKEMLRSFQPEEKMIAAKLEANEDYQKLQQENPWEKHELFLVETAEIAENDPLLETIRQELNTSPTYGLTDATSQSMVYKEEKYLKQQLEEVFSEGAAGQLRKTGWLLLPENEEKGFRLLHLKSIEVSDLALLTRRLQQQGEKEKDLRRQAEEEIRDESFEVIYQEWKKETDIRIDQEAWQEYTVFEL